MELIEILVLSIPLILVAILPAVVFVYLLLNREFRTRIELPKTIFKRGEIISGNIFFKFRKSIFLKKIDVSLVGYEYYASFNPLAQKKRMIHNFTKTITLNKKYDRGEYRIPFSIKIPRRIPISRKYNFFLRILLFVFKGITNVGLMWRVESKLTLFGFYLKKATTIFIFEKLPWKNK